MGLGARPRPDACVTEARCPGVTITPYRRVARTRGGEVDEFLAEVFSSRVRAAVLGHLLPRPHRRFSLTDLHHRLDLPISSLQHECYKLERIGVLVARREGNARRYHPDPACPLLPPLTALVLAAVGPVAALRGAVDGLDGLEAAFLAGALPGVPAPADDPAAGDWADDPRVASGEPGPPRLVLVGDLALDDLAGAQARAEAALGRPPGGVELAFFRPDDWRLRRAEGGPYVAALLLTPRIDLVGTVEAAP